MFKKIIFGLIALVICQIAQAKIQQIPATGVGTTRDIAILNAVENAVRQYNGVSIVQNDPTMRISEKQHVNVSGQKTDKKGKQETMKAGVVIYSDKIVEQVNATYKGKVNSYEITQEEKTDTGYKVSIVASFKEMDSYTAGKLAAKKEYSLAVPVFYNKQYTLCSEKKTATLLDNATFDLKEKLSATRHFKLLDRQNFSAYAEELALVAGGATQEVELKRLQNIIPADYILVGKVRQFDFSSQKETLDLLGEIQIKTQGKLIVEFSLLESATMENIFTTRSSFSFFQTGKQLDCETVFGILSNKVATETTGKINNRLFPEQVRQSNSYKKAAPIKEKETETQRPVVKLPFDK